MNRNTKIGPPTLQALEPGGTERQAGLTVSTLIARDVSVVTLPDSPGHHGGCPGIVTPSPSPSPELSGPARSLYSRFLVRLADHDPLGAW